MINARYTLTLKTIMEDEHLKPKLEQAMSTYPLYTQKSVEEYIPSIIPTREELNTKILNYYKYREIGFETIGRFLDELEISLNEIMPYYNQLFFSADQDYNIIYNVDYKRTIDTNKTGTSSTTGENSTSGSSQNSLTGKDTKVSSGKDITETIEADNNTNKEISSDTPQDSLSITTNNIGNVKYADNVKWQNGTDNHTATNENTSNNTTTNDTTQSSSGSNSETSNSQIDGTTTDTESTLETTKGNFGVQSAQRLVKEYREIIINIEQKIINDPRIRELFMLVY